MEQYPYQQNNMQFSGAAYGTWSDDNEILNLEPIPVGYRFLPTDEELIEDYLKKKVNNEPLPLNLVHDVVFYNKDPIQFVAEYEPITEREWYFFRPRDKKYPNGLRPNRATPNGYWKPNGKEKNISHDSRHPVGKKRTLDFYEGKHPGGTRTIWKMHEYTLVNNSNNHNTLHNGRPRGYMKLDDWVLCKLYKNQRSGGGEASTSGSGIQSSIVNIAYNNNNNETANSVDGSSNFEYENQSTVYVPQNNEVSNEANIGCLLATDSDDHAVGNKFKKFSA